MTIHREGFTSLAIVLLVLCLLNLLAYQFLNMLFPLVLLASVGFFLFILQFFRNPKRELPEKNEHLIYAPADGRIVVIEETNEPEYFQDRRIQISIFMSPTNVHVNRNPISGEVKYVKYHPGKYLVAWHPKSSTENERHTVVIDNGQKALLMRQIAGAVARRIKNYLSEGLNVQQGAEMGFIKFGSRVDLFLPLDTTITVKIGDKVKGNKTVIGRFE